MGDDTDYCFKGSLGNGKWSSPIRYLARQRGALYMGRARLENGSHAPLPCLVSALPKRCNDINTYLLFSIIY